MKSSVKFPSILIHGAGFDVLLGMALISATQVSLNAETKTLRLKENDYRYNQLSIPAPHAKVALSQCTSNWPPQFLNVRRCL